MPLFAPHSRRTLLAFSSFLLLTVWVSYEQQDPARGRKRETRLMKRIDGRWRIAGMQTIIYGGPSPEP